MARLPRYFIPEQPQHIIQRGNNREPIFAADEDYQFYLECLLQASKEHGLDIHAYVLMTNHIHLLATPSFESSIPKTFQSIGRRYVQYFNHTYNRTGTLWEGRYKATIIDSEQYLLNCSRYIELNPVRADMVEHCKHYPWSSYHRNALGVDDELIKPHDLYSQLGKDAVEQQINYRNLFTCHLSKELLNDIREATNKGWALGNETFLAKVEVLNDRRLKPRKAGRHKSVPASQ
jgi:REP-associated tyrosine transposase